MAAGTLKYGQSNLDISDEMDVERDRARYDADRAKDLLLAGTHGIDEVMAAERLDAVLFPGASGAAIAARVGYPTVIVPFGMVPNAPTPPFPGGIQREARAVRRQLHRHARAASRGSSSSPTRSSASHENACRRRAHPDTR